MKKNVFYIGLALTLCLSLLAGCSPKEPTADHENNPSPDGSPTVPGTPDVETTVPGTPDGEEPDPGESSVGYVLEWDRDANEHWKTGPGGEPTDVAPHSLNEESICTVCGSEVWQYDGLGDVFNYDEAGNLLRATRYSADGKVLSEGYYEYTLWDDGEYHLAVVTELYEDGIRCRSEYDRWGDLVSWFRYDGEDTLLSELHYEYTHDPDGTPHMLRMSNRHQDGSEYISEYNEYGDQTAWLAYDGNGTLTEEERYEWEYDDEGHRLSQKVYVSGVLTREVRYFSYTDGAGWWTREQHVTQYFADGSRLVTEYDENGGILSATTYDAEGNVKSFG